MKDALRHLVDERDRRMTAPRRLNLLRRSEANERRVCVGCRRQPDEAAWADFHDRYSAATTALERVTMKWPELHHGPRCPHCGGELVEVVW